MKGTTGMTFIKNLIYGMIIGIANIIPGVSGGTMMVVLDVFDRLVDAIGNIRNQFKKSVRLLLPIGIGALAAILLFSSIISWLLDHHYMVTNFFFIGVILGSIPLVWRKATADRFKPAHLVPCAVTLALMLFTVYFAPSAAETIVRSLSPLVFVKLLLISAVSAICMIIPGISGSFVMLLFGTYETVTTALAEFNVLVLIPIAIGIVLGLVFGSKLISILLHRYPQATYFSILGFMLGSVPAIVDKIREANAFVGGWSVAAAIVVLIFGTLLSYLFSDEKFKNGLIQRFGKGKKSTEKN